MRLMRLIRLGRLLLILTIVLFADLQAGATFWNVEQVYGGGFGSGDASLAVVYPNVYASFSANGGLFFATKGIESWTSEYVATVGYFGGWSSLGYNNSQPCIAYIDGSGSSNILRYAYKSSGVWHTEQVDDVGWLPDRISMAFNVGGEACIAYTKTSGTYPNTVCYLSFARRTGINTWVKTNIKQIGQITGPSLVISSGLIHYISYINSATGQLQVASKIINEDTWIINTIDGSAASPGVGYTALSLQPGGKPAVAYFQHNSGAVHLKYAALEGTTWKLSSPLTDLTAGIKYECALGVTLNKVPLIAYTDPSTDTLKHAWLSGGKWVTETIDTGSQTGGYPTLRLDGYGNVHTSYIDGLNSNVSYASALEPRPIPNAKSRPDDTVVQISGVVAANAGNELANRVYAQELDRAAGIQILFDTSTNIKRGDLLNIQGTLSTINGEKAIIDPIVEILGPQGSPRPLSMTNMNIGGTDFRYVAGPPSSGQKGVVGGSGPNNIGLLVTTWGKLTPINADYFTVDDGSGSPVKCYAPGFAPQTENLFAVVRGISSCEQSGLNLTKLLRVRSSSDIVTFTR